MSTIPYDGPEETWDSHQDEDSVGLPRRRRRQWLTRASALLFAAVVGAACFYAGVRVEKGQLSSSSTSPLSALTSGTGSTAAGASRAGAAGRSGIASLFGGGARASLFGGAGGATFGTVSSIQGKNVYVTETSTGDVVKVTLSSATTITKSVGVGKSAIRPGDTVTVVGAKNAKGGISATSVSDSGSRSGAQGASSSSSSSSSSSALSSLFGGG
jgi:hypothetical protein